jgi:hypothetical protein
MNLKPKRKAKLSEFTIKEYGINGGLMAILFLFGLFLSWKLSTFAGFLYLLLWVAPIHSSMQPLAEIVYTTASSALYHWKEGAHT